MADNSAMTQFSVTNTSPMSYTEWAHSTGQAPVATDYGVLGDFTNFLGGKRTLAEKDYQAYLSKFQNDLEERRLNSAREYERYMDSTKYQRAFEDAKKAGINPYTLLGSSSLATNASSSATSVGAHAPKVAIKEKNNILTSALKVLALIALKS